MYNTNLESTDDGELQRMWKNLPSFSSLDFCIPMSRLDIPSKSVLSPCLEESAYQYEALLISSSSLLSSSESLRDSHEVASVFPGVSDMFLVLEHNSQEACLLPGCEAALECGPDGGDVHVSPLTLAVAPPLYSHGKIKHHNYTPVYEAPPLLTLGKVSGRDSFSLSPVQPCKDRVNSDQLASRTVLQKAVREQLSKQAGLHSRAQGLQRRLQALLGEHALRHCDHQLEGLKRHCQLGDRSIDSSDSTQHGTPLPQVGCKPNSPQLDSSTSPSFTEVEEFGLSIQAVLRGLQEALDSEATASSSSDEEPEENMSHGNIKTSPVCGRQWLEERAELGSRWSWLQLRLADLEGKIQQLVELHKHIRSTKGGVVLAESQPLTDIQIQQTLLREMAGLSCTALDTDNESCSPTRLLYSIERQSAQLSQLVNSLMPPLSFSPLSKQSKTCKNKRAFMSGKSGDKPFVLGSTKRRRLGTKRLLKAEQSCVCARTRPLVRYHKPKLFTLNIFSSPQDSTLSNSTPSSFLSMSSCSSSSSWEPLVLCSDPECSSSRALSSRTPSSTPPKLKGHALDTPLSNHLKSVHAREEWCQRPLVINVQPSGPANYNKCSSTPLPNRHKYKQYAWHCKNGVCSLSPSGMVRAARNQLRRARQRKRKRRHIPRRTEDKEDVPFEPCYLDDSSDDVLKQSYTEMTPKQASEGFVRKRPAVSVYNINNIVIPSSAARVEKLQYKDIQTPSWRLIDPSHLINRQTKVEDNEDREMEDLADDFFAKRHRVLEQREKLCRGCWGKRRSYRRPKRYSGSGVWTCTSGEESSMDSCAQLDTDVQLSTGEWLPQTPWEQRVFPLDMVGEEALLSEDPAKFHPEWSPAFSISKISNSHLHPRLSSGATLLPSAGQNSSRPLDSS